MNTFGLWVGVVTLLIIGLGFVWVILGERKLTHHWWPYFVLLGLLIIGISLFIHHDFLSAIVGVLGASFVWGATELKAQAVRSELGWFKYHAQKIPAPLEKIIKKIPFPKI
jgi:hypothetical protein